MKKKFYLLMLILISIFTNSCTDIDDKLAPITGTGEIIKKDSELFDLISRVTTDSDEPMKHLPCIDFVYPIALYVYNADLEVVDLVSPANDVAFSDLLESLPQSYSISITYPITTTLDDGTIVSVNNNAELKQALDNCKKHIMLEYLEGEFVRCVWSVEYTENGSNDYVGGIFHPVVNGIIQFEYDDVFHNGTWALLFVNDELQLNIFLEGDSDAAQDMSLSYPVTYEANTYRVHTPEGDITLQMMCEYTAPFAIGDTGPAEGIVFYDKGYYSKGWRYMEAMPQDLAPAQWGCASAAIPSTGITTVGSGKKLSSLVASYHDSIDYYVNPGSCNSANDGSVAAKAALLQPGARWFLPSEDELALLYLNLHQAGLGNFNNSLYWSSTSAGAGEAKAFNFATGAAEATSKTQSLKIRAIRYF